MATITLDLEIHSLPAHISNLGAYQNALILLRLGQLPVACVHMPVFQGYISGEELAQAAANSLDGNFWKLWAVDFLEMTSSNPAWVRAPSATIAVCTRDRPVDLARCLEGISQMPDDGQEILVVDSASATLETRQVTERFPGVRYLRVDLPGLDRARNFALSNAHNEIVAFIDDDAVPDTGWLRALLKNFQDPLVMAVTGLTMPLELETEAQELFERYYSFSRGFQKQIFERRNRHPLMVGPVGAGANMAYRRSVKDKVGFFEEALDAGTPTQSGGEADMFSRILSTGYRIVYDPAALNWHRHRRTIKDLHHTVYGYGVGVYAFWTRRLVYDRELTAPLIALGWLWSNQLPDLVRGFFKRPGVAPLKLQFALLAGCLYGPLAYFISRRQIARLQARSRS